MSPLDISEGPGQFVFLVALATSTLTIALIGNRLRDIIHEIKSKHVNYELNSGYIKAFSEWRVINYLIVSQTALIFLILLRIFLSSLGIQYLFYDQILIFIALVVLGVAWLVYFAWVTWIN